MAEVAKEAAESKAPAAKAGETAPVKEPARPSLWDPFAAMRTEIDRVIDQFGRGPFGPGTLSDWTNAGARFAEGLTGAVLPSADMRESNGEVIVTVELPGMSEADVSVTYSDDMLTVKGEKRDEKTSGDDEQAHIVERRYGSFRRSFRLPPTVDADKLAASFDKGVLTVTAPKRADAAKAEREIKIAGKS